MTKPHTRQTLRSLALLMLLGVQLCALPAHSGSHLAADDCAICQLAEQLAVPAELAQSHPLTAPLAEPAPLPDFQPIPQTLAPRPRGPPAIS